MFTWLNESTTYLRGNRKHYYAIVLTHNKIKIKTTSVVFVARSVVFSVVFCRSLFVLLSFLFWPLCCLSFDLRSLITYLVSSNSSKSMLPQCTNWSSSMISMKSKGFSNHDQEEDKMNIYFRIWCPTHVVLCFCFVFLRLVYPMLPVSLDCPVLIVLSVFSNDYYQPILNIVPFF
jgi:hypothetical protein